MVFGFGRSDSDEEKEKRRKQEEEEEEEKKKRLGRRPGKHAAGEDQGDEEGEGHHGGGRRRPGRPVRKDGDEEEEKEEGDEGGRKRPGRRRPGRHGRKDGDEEEEEEEEAEGHGKAARPGRHGRPNPEEEETDEPGGRRPGSRRPGRLGRQDNGEEEEEEDAGKPVCPGRHGRKDEEEPEGEGRPTRPGRHGRKNDDETTETAAATAAAGRPGRHGRKDEDDEPAHGRPHRPGRHGHHEEDDHEVSTAGQHEGHGGGGTVTVRAGDSIQDALKRAQPGTTILLEAGTYNESIKTRVDGTKEQPITIKGPGSGPAAIIKGDDKSGSCVEINHDYYVLDDFTIDGTINEHCNKDNVRESFRAKCLTIRGERNHRALTKENGDHYVSAVDGVIVKNMKINNSGGEGIRLRYFVTNCTISHNCITSTGCYDFKFGGDQGRKNGEGIYVGTSSTQWRDNPSGEPDICRFNHIFENYIDTNGNECVDVKEGAMNNIIETNYCTGQLDEDSGGIDSRGNENIIRYNKIVGCKGAGVRLGGHEVDGVQYGVNCQVYGNILKDNDFTGIKVMTKPHQICENRIDGCGRNYKVFRGTCAKEFEENSECPFDTDAPKQDIETTRWFQSCKP